MLNVKFWKLSTGELKIVHEEGEKRIRSCQALSLGTTWGPFPGKIEMATGDGDKVSFVFLSFCIRKDLGGNYEVVVWMHCISFVLLTNKHKNPLAPRQHTVSH